MRGLTQDDKTMSSTWLIISSRAAHVCMYVRTYVCMYVCTYVRTYVCTYVRMYVCTFRLPEVLLLNSSTNLRKRSILNIFRKESDMHVRMYVRQKPLLHKAQQIDGCVL